MDTDTDTEWILITKENYNCTFQFVATMTKRFKSYIFSLSDLTMLINVKMIRMASQIKIGGLYFSQKQSAEFQRKVSVCQGWKNKR